MLVLFGIIEMSLFMRDVVSVSSSVHVGTRMASVAAGAGPATCTPSPCTPPTAPALAQLAANAIQQAGSAMPQDQINWIEVYNANTSGFPMPAGNTTSTCSTDCVKYVWNSTKNQFVYSSGSWSSASINACINDPEPDVGRRDHERHAPVDHRLVRQRGDRPGAECHAVRASDQRFVQARPPNAHA